MREDGFLPLTAVRPLLELFVKGVEIGGDGSRWTCPQGLFWCASPVAPVYLGNRGSEGCPGLV